MHQSVCQYASASVHASVPQRKLEKKETERKERNGPLDVKESYNIALFQWCCAIPVLLQYKILFIAGEHA